MLEETLQICLQMWSEDDGPYEGKHYRLGRTLNVPQPIRRPPILAQLRGLAALGVGEVHGWVPRVWQTERLELLGKEIVAAAAEF